MLGEGIREGSPVPRHLLFVVVRAINLKNYLKNSSLTK